MPQAKLRTKTTKEQGTAAKPTATVYEHQVKIDWQVPPGITTRLATHFVVQITPQQEVLLSFFEIHLPYIVGTEEEQRSQMDRIKEIEAECVGRVSMTPARMGELIQALQQQMQSFGASVQPAIEEM